MKILAIRGKNLASLEGEFDIDFTTEPLLSAGIFAITGSTGSGKSTLLDALCLALFDDTPRANRAGENVNVIDVRDQTINQRDSRNILRRGTGEGYAEVDFISLAGEKYRSRWSVRRSRNKVDGALQSIGFTLTNLTTNTEEQGRKTELLAKIEQLIGLTFDQFTRAVLLAQGDFATFLKANQKEKAELLEKLTGTEIYSRISVAIFDKSRSAEQELNNLKERIKDIELLSDEEQVALSEEKETIAKDVLALNANIEIWTNKLKWIADELALKQGVEQAERTLATAQQAIDEAKPRYDYLARLDSVQEIRDCFGELKNANRQLTDNQKSLIDHEEALNKNGLLLKEALEKITVCEADKKAHEKDLLAVMPKIKEARVLDIQLINAKANLSAADKEKKGADDKKTKLEKSIAATQASLDAATAKIKQINNWFEQHAQYQTIMPRVDLIVNLLSDLENVIKQKAKNETTLASSKTVLDGETAQLLELTNEAARLNSLLPSEIAALRAKLEDGIPCPVCGSTHHPASQVSGESLEEAELNKAKKAVAKKLETLTLQVEERKADHIRLTTVIENYTTQASGAKKQLDGYLANFPEWEQAFKRGGMQASLKEMAAVWDKNEKAKSEANAQIANGQTSLQLAGEQLTEAIDSCVAKEKTWEDAKVLLDNLQKNRAVLLDGKDADEVEAAYSKKGEKLAAAWTALEKKQSDITATNNTLSGTIAQIKQEIEKLTKQSALAQTAVDDWLSSKEGTISLEHLSELLSKNNTWITVEREQLNRLHQQKTTSLATLAERKKTLENHASKENKPTEEETTEVLQQLLAENKQLWQQKTERKAEIDLLFVNHRRGQARVKEIEHELNEKSLLSENWKKLNEVFGSADGSKFKVLAQGYTLDILLSYANKHLQELTKRYAIQRIPGVLALQVVDLDMLGETRSVHSLSGGESFLVSLALALGLSSLSSNRMKIESLFIDEGFGSLDIETLRVAMDALERLQTQGRKIGVISHVAEMTERITTQICVEKMVNGRSKIEIKGA
ncbi:exonuclease SbcC [Parabacteroides sp. PFB2-12]|uniref:AAA family ATPase n=1 Tax=unclassified Parabacteroides TaxID=2649774 RepID=UPI00247393AF|nr:MULTISPECIES: AAA family ATPase [unclassified Parabacteroides]MDH6341949.1 exonuclease SbcC [Parabacteroides sp. PM6-13]MDH6389647.1 exonuclease SbcC [Parabacteroides sp. PFB2-12]